jgi:hypothetical protein
MINIAQRPPEANDRAVPGHWEDDWLIGKRNQTAIATLVERTTGYAMLVGLPDGDKPEHVAPALAAKIQTLPQALRRSLTWDQGDEMRDSTDFATVTETQLDARIRRSACGTRRWSLFGRQPARPWRVGVSGVLERVGSRPCGCPHRDS